MPYPKCIRYLKTYINQTSTVVWYKLEGEVIYITMNGSSVGSCSGETITSSVLMENIHSRVCLRFFDQVGHETMCAFSRNKHFLTKKGIILQVTILRKRKYNFWRNAHYRLESVQDFLIKLDMKPCIHLVEISIFD